MKSAGAASGKGQLKSTRVSRKRKAPKRTSPRKVPASLQDRIMIPDPKLYNTNPTSVSLPHFKAYHLGNIIFCMIMILHRAQRGWPGLMLQGLTVMHVYTKRVSKLDNLQSDAWNFLHQQDFAMEQTRLKFLKSQIYMLIYFRFAQNSLQMMAYKKLKNKSNRSSLQVPYED